MSSKKIMQMSVYCVNRLFIVCEFVNSNKCDPEDRVRRPQDPRVGERAAHLEY